MRQRPFLKKMDIVWLLVLILFAFTGWYRLQAGEVRQVNADVFVGSKKIMVLPLRIGQEEKTINISNTNVDLQLYADGGIAFIHSDCPDQVCIRAGVLRYAGQVAACLPNRVFVRLVAANVDSDVLDAVVGSHE